MNLQTKLVLAGVAVAVAVGVYEIRQAREGMPTPKQSNLGDPFEMLKAPAAVPAPSAPAPAPASVGEKPPMPEGFTPQVLPPEKIKETIGEMRKMSEGQIAALASERKAAEMLKTYATCLTDEKQFSLHRLCLKNARDLVAKYPALEGQAPNLRAPASESSALPEVPPAPARDSK